MIKTSESGVAEWKHRSFFGQMEVFNPLCFCERQTPESLAAKKKEKSLAELLMCTTFQYFSLEAVSCRSCFVLAQTQTLTDQINAGCQ